MKSEFKRVVTQASTEMLARWILKNLDWSGGNDDANGAFLTSILLEHRRQAASPSSSNSESNNAARDWPEDFAHENGNYSNICHACKNTFLGHKRRVTCRVCAAPSSSSEKPSEALTPRTDAECAHAGTFDAAVEEKE